MMTTKEKFLSLKSYEEFDKRREEFGDLDVSDEEVREHFSVVFPPLKSSGFENGVIYDVQKEKPSKGVKIK